MNLVQKLFDNLKQLPSDYKGMTSQFVNQIMSMERWYIQQNQEVDPILWNQRKWFQISERDWFKSANVCAQGIVERGKRQSPGSPPRGAREGSGLNSSPKRKPPRKRKT
jgi:hypothetical protein